MHLKVTCTAFVILTVTLIKFTLLTNAATIQDDNLDNRRSKRSLTTICVEIKPNKPQEESYFMCKDSDFPNFRTEMPNFGSNEPMPRYDEVRTTSVPAYEKENYFRISATHDSEPRAFQQQTINNAPHVYKDERFQLQSLPAPSAFHQQPKIAPTTFLAKNVQTNFQNSHAQQQQQQQFRTENPIQTTSSNAQPAFDIRYTTGTAQPKPFSAAKTIDQTTSAVHTNRPHEIQQYHRKIFTKPTEPFGVQNLPRPTSFGHSGSFTPSSFVRNDKVAHFEKTPIFPTINDAHEIATPIMARKFTNNPFTTTTKTTAAAATAATTATTPTESMASHKIAAPLEKAIMPTEYFDKSRYRMTIDENSLKVPSWSFSQNDFDPFRFYSDNKRAQLRENSNTDDEFMLGAVPVELSKIVIPYEHLDDPVMRTFYESIYDANLPPTPPPTPPIAPIVGAMANAPVDAFERSYSPEVVKTERCSAQHHNTPTYVAQQPSPPYVAQQPHHHVTQVAQPMSSCGSATPYQQLGTPNYVTQPVSSCIPTTPYQQLGAVQQIQPSLNNVPYGQLSKAAIGCPACPTQARNFQPVIIALPLYSQQTTPQQYDVDGAPQVSSALGQQQITEPMVAYANPLSNLLFGPRIFDLFNPIRGLLGQTAPGSHNPYAVLNVAPMTLPATLQIPDNQNMNFPMEKSKPSTNNEKNKSRKVAKNENTKENDDAIKSEEINNDDDDDVTVSVSLEIESESKEQSKEQIESTTMNGESISAGNISKATTKTKNEKKDDSKKSKENTNLTEIPKELEEESKKTFKTLIDAAKTFSNIAQTDTENDTEFATEHATTETTGRIGKRQQSKGGPNIGNFMRKSYKMKL